MVQVTYITLATIYTLLLLSLARETERGNIRCEWSTSIVLYSSLYFCCMRSKSIWFVLGRAAERWGVSEGSIRISKGGRVRAFKGS